MKAIFLAVILPTLGAQSAPNSESAQAAEIRASVEIISPLQVTFQPWLEPNLLGSQDTIGGQWSISRDPTLSSSCANQCYRVDIE